MNKPMPMFITPPSSFSPTRDWQEFLNGLKRWPQENPSIKRNIQLAEETLERRRKETPEKRRVLYHDPD
jgi:hypothetical protein